MSEYDLSGSSPNPADQDAGYNSHNTPSGAGSPSDGGNGPDLSEYDLSGNSPNPADQDAGYNSHNTPSGAGSQSDGGDGPDLSGYDLSGSSPNPADQDAGYNSHNTPSGAGGDGGGGGGGKPVLLDLDGDGVELIELEDSTAFYDIHGTGYRHQLSWVGPDDGILAYDRDGDGEIREREEISFVDYVEGARTDLEGLRHFDTNGDSELTEADDEWGSFRVWQDLDQDGVSDPGELRTLDEAGIHSISLVSSGEPETRADGTRVFGRGTYVVDDGGTAVTRELLDVELRVSPWGFREAEGGMEIRWAEGDGCGVSFIAATDETLTLDAAANGYCAVIGGGGDDRLSNSGSDTVMLAGKGGDDVLRGGEGNDLILGGDDDDALYGGAGSDLMDGGGGNDVVNGEAGDDILHGGEGEDTLDGGADTDTIWYDASDAGVTVDLRDGDGDGFHDAASGGHAEGDRIRNFENVVGSAYDDVLTGDDGANRLAGWDGDDRLSGGGGDDELVGGAGRDTVHGGAGDDTLAAGSNEGGGWQELYGEAGSDTYRIGMSDGMVRIGSAAEGRSDVDSDTVEFTDLALADVEFTVHDYTAGGTVNSPEGVALVIRWAKDGHTGEVHIAGMGRSIERFVFADGSTLGRVEADLLARVLPERFGDAQEDWLIGTPGDDVVTSGAGDERIEGGDGADRLAGGGGSDRLEGEDGDDTLHGGEGNDAPAGWRGFGRPGRRVGGGLAVWRRGG